MIYISTWTGTKKPCSSYTEKEKVIDTSTCIAKKTMITSGTLA